MEIKLFRLPKKTGTYADALAIVGLERLLDLLGASRATIRDQGGFYELTFKKPVNLEDLDYEAVHDDPGYRYIKLKESSPAPPNHLDYPGGRERLLNYRRIRDGLRKATGGRLTEEQQSQLKQVEPDSRWYLYQNTNVLKGFGPYNKLHEEITKSEPEAFAAALHGKLTAMVPNNSGSTVKEEFRPKIPAVQVFTPHVGKGANAVKTAGVRAAGLPDNFVDWFDEYLKYLGLERAANARAVGDDIKLFVITPGDITAATLGGVSERFFRLNLPWSSAQIDIQGALGLAEGLVTQIAQGSLEEFGKTPRGYVSGLQTAYFKSLGSARALANVGFIGLPRWFPVTEDNADEWLEILEEHRKVLVILNEERSEEAELLLLYRDFLSATDSRKLLEFLASYASHVVRFRERKRFVRQFTTKNLRRLLVRLSSRFKDIVDDPGFRAVAGAIRRATVTEQYHSSQNNRVFEIEYGLFQDFKRKARFPDQFVGALSEFVNTYNSQNARREEQLKGKPGRRRSRLTVGELDRVVELMDRHGSEMVAMLLIAYGSARDPRAPDEAGEAAQAHDAVVEERIGEESIG
ncbi:hypothetical protein BH24ACT19_BH24ACT19_04490 [soil metagenome]